MQKKFDLDSDRQILFILAQNFQTFPVRGDGEAEKGRRRTKENDG